MTSVTLGTKAGSSLCLLLIAVALFLSPQTTQAQEFTYDGQRGPAHWGEAYKSCTGKHQSPINIDDLNVVEYEFPPLELANFDEVPKSAKLINNGHTVQVKMGYEPGKEPVLRGGPLGFFIPGFQLEQFHLHWGENDTIGSEDLINNASFPAELHVVLRSLKYKSFEVAMNQGDGLVVLAFFFKIYSEDNPSYTEFSDLLEKVPKSGMSTEFPEPLSLMSFLTYDLLHYYTYIGSLTTPPCSEDVVWIDFSQPIDISESQLNRLRQLTNDEQHPLMNNFRPTQPLNDRKVYKAVRPVVTFPLMSAIPFVDAANGGLSHLKDVQPLFAIVLSFVALWTLRRF